jgi:hypothetical protein
MNRNIFFASFETTRTNCQRRAKLSEPFTNIAQSVFAVNYLYPLNIVFRTVIFPEKAPVLFTVFDRDSGVKFKPGTKRLRR